MTIEFAKYLLDNKFGIDRTFIQYISITEVKIKFYHYAPNTDDDRIWLYFSNLYTEGRGLEEKKFIVGIEQWSDYQKKMRIEKLKELGI